MKREPGYYWVKMSWGEWTIEEWRDGKWQDHGCQDGNDYYVSFFEEIDERRIEREPCVAPPDEQDLEMKTEFNRLPLLNKKTR